MAKKEKEEVAQTEGKKEKPKKVPPAKKKKAAAKKPKKEKAPAKKPEEKVAPPKKEEKPPVEKPEEKKAPPKKEEEPETPAVEEIKEEPKPEAEEPKEVAPAKEEKAPAEKPIEEKAPAKKPKEKKAPPKKKEEPPVEKPEEKVAPPKKEEEPPVEKPEEKVAPPKKEEKKEPKPTGEVPLLFDKYDFTEVEVEDQGLRRYINLKPIVIPHTGAKHANKRFGRAKMNIVERLINNMMRTERFTGKKSKAYSTVSRAFEVIEKKAKRNPIQVLVNALQNAAPREEVTRLRFGGISVPRAVDIAPSRRLDIAMRNVCKGAVASTHKSKKAIENCLADEILMAAQGDMNSFSITKKEEMERVAVSAR
jgi:small subunit ribosomal protein S7